MPINKIYVCRRCSDNPGSKVHGVIIGPIWGRQGPGGPNIGPMNFATWAHLQPGLNIWLQWIGQRLQDETRNIYVSGFGAAYIRGLTVCWPHTTQHPAQYDNKGNNTPTNLGNQQAISIFRPHWWATGVLFGENGDEIWREHYHYSDVRMTTMASQITSLPVVCSIVYSDADQRKHQSSASLAFVRRPVNSPHKSNAENVSIWWRHHDIVLYTSRV